MTAEAECGWPFHRDPACPTCPQYDAMYAANLEGRRVWVLRLPYVLPPLSLNDSPSIHWAVTAGKKAKIRAEIGVLCKQNGVKKCESVHVLLTYYPKTRRNRDPDNLIATQKPAIDGLVSAGIIPDDTPQYLTWAPPVIADPRPKDPHLTFTITGKVAD